MKTWMVLVSVLLLTTKVPAGKVGYFFKTDETSGAERGATRPLQSSDLNGPCSSNSECTVENAECSNSTCKCKKGFVIVDRDCKEAATHLGEGCESENQCSENLGKNVDCRDYSCVCRENYVSSQSAQACLPKLNLYDQCEEPVQCVLTNSTTCKDGICSCLPGFSSVESARCMPDKVYGQECSHPAECMTKNGQFASCREGKCACESNAYYNGTACLKKNGLDEACDFMQFEGCYTEKGGHQNMECYERKCRCTSNAKVAADGPYCEPSSGRVALVSISVLLAALLATTSV
ncbi:multiple epidermal growth factor-like domains protein 11 isoform X2 [Anabrus simplex]|uniref:multiple epidermal growth factor-like domains protein 11 isoform X2 n=1 Tax=Anabrus simplex TaxID=316456 RepID=UPI0034DD4FD1